MHYLPVRSRTISSEGISYILKFTEFTKLRDLAVSASSWTFIRRDQIKLALCAVAGSVTSLHAVENHDGQIPREMSFSFRKDNLYGREREIRA